jgi:hypothetical protein
MEKSNDNLFELMTANKKRRNAIQEVLSGMEKYPHLGFTKKRLKEGDFWEVFEVGKKTMGTIMIMDLPEDLGLKETVIRLLNEEYDRLQKEFDSYTIKK